MKKTIISLTALFFSTFSLADCHPFLMKTSASPTFQTGLDNLYSFSYVRKALRLAQKEIGDSQICTSLIGLEKNNYHYNKYLVHAEVITLDNKSRRDFYFLYQDASVQAYHNHGGQPWVGLSNRVVEDLVSPLSSSDSFIEFADDVTTPDEAVKSSVSYIRTKDFMDPSSFSAIKLRSVSGEELTAYTWQSRSENNPFSTSVSAQGVLVKKNSDGKISVSERFLPLENLSFPLEESRNLKAKELGHEGADWVEQVLKFSKVQ